MTTDRDLLTEAADLLDRLTEAATDGPWWCDDNDQYWRLHGVHAYLPVTFGGHTINQVINHQILKAPKQSKIFAPYWPGAADAQMITTMANPLVGRALAAALRAAATTDQTAPDLVEVARAVLAPKPND